MEDIEKKAYDDEFNRSQDETIENSNVVLSEHPPIEMKTYTPENIQTLETYEIFVFGSNEAGLHYGGAARQAYESFGAKWGVGQGLICNTYAIPTKDKNFKTLSTKKIKAYIKEFLEFVLHNQFMTFYLTKIGCGIAGLSTETIKKIFWEAVDELRTESDCEQFLPANLIIPKEFENEKKSDLW